MPRSVPFSRLNDTLRATMWGFRPKLSNSSCPQLLATARLVAHERPGARVHVFGNPGLLSEIERFGLTVTDAADADYVVVGNHRGITYERMTAAMRALLRGARFVVVNMDRTYVGADGGLVSGCGTFAQALAYAVGS